MSTKWFSERCQHGGWSPRALSRAVSERHWAPGDISTIPSEGAWVSETTVTPWLPGGESTLHGLIAGGVLFSASAQTETACVPLLYRLPATPAPSLAMNPRHWSYLYSVSGHFDEIMKMPGYPLPKTTNKNHNNNHRLKTPLNLFHKHTKVYIRPGGTTESMV